MHMVSPPCDGDHPEFSREPRNTKKTYFTPTPPPNLPKRLIRGGGAGRGATVRRTLRDREHTKTGKLSDFDAPGGPPGLSSPEKFRVSRRSRRLPHRTRAPLMYRTWARRGGTRGSVKLLLGTAKTVAWRGKVRFLAVAEKTRCKQLLSKQNLFCAPTQLTDCKDITVWDSSILCPKVVQAMTHLPCFFG